MADEERVELLADLIKQAEGYAREAADKRARYMELRKRSRLAGNDGTDHWDELIAIQDAAVRQYEAAALFLTHQHSIEWHS